MKIEFAPSPYDPPSISSDYGTRRLILKPYPVPSLMRKQFADVLPQGRLRRVWRNVPGVRSNENTTGDDPRLALAL